MHMALSKADYSPFLSVREDGSIWWPLEDAIKLATGYLPSPDFEENCRPVLTAPSDEIIRNGKELLCEFSKELHSESRPQVVVVDDLRYVEARDFIDWIYTYISYTHAAIPCPDELARAVMLAAFPSRGKDVKYESLSAVLDGYFDKSIAEMPDEQLSRVMSDFLPIPWDDLTQNDRRDMAQAWDLENNPDASHPPTMKNEVSVTYLPYPKAMQELDHLHSATPNELAAWVCLGRERGGLTAFTMVFGRISPTVFSYDLCKDGIAAAKNDYLLPLMSCWFRDEEIAQFRPTHRFITGKELIERWSDREGIHVVGYIIAKVLESRLAEIHPFARPPEADDPLDDTCQYIEKTLFLLSDVETIDAEDFGDNAAKPSGNEIGNFPPLNNYGIIKYFRVLPNEGENEGWWTRKFDAQKRNHLIDCRVGEGKTGPGGRTLWRPDQIAGWLVDRHDKGRLGLNSKAARSMLKKIPGYADIAEEQFACDE